MKLLHVIRSLNPECGGPVESINQIATAMAEIGHCTEVLTIDDPRAHWLRDFPFSVHALGPGKGIYGFARGLVPWLKEFGSSYDAVIVRGIWQYHSFGTWRALHKSRTPYFVFLHGMLDPWFKHAFPIKHAKKWLYWPWAEYRVLRDARAVLFTCEEERILARESFWLYRCHEEVVSYGTSNPPGIADAQREAFFSLYPKLRNKRLMLFLGRIHRKKGCDLLIDAYARVVGDDPNWHLVIAGPDQDGLQSTLMARAHQNNLDESITWTGMILGDVKYGAIRAADVFVLASHQENFGIVVAEALACGTPVLITTKVNIWREVEQDRAGIVSGDDFQGVCSILRKWLTLSPNDKECMGQRARHCFFSRFEIRNCAASIIQTISPYVETIPPDAPQSGTMVKHPFAANQHARETNQTREINETNDQRISVA